MSRKTVWLVFGCKLRILREKARVSPEDVNALLPPESKGKLESIESGETAPNAATLAVLSELYGTAENLESERQELERSPNGHLYRKIFREYYKPIVIAAANHTAQEAPQDSLMQRASALITRPLLVLAVVPAGFAFCVGFALPVALGAPGHDVGISNLARSELTTTSALVIAGAAYAIAAAIFDGPIDDLVISLRRRLPGLGKTDRAIDQALASAGMKNSRGEVIRDTMRLISIDCGQRASFDQNEALWLGSERLILHLVVAWAASGALLGASASPWIGYTAIFPVMIVLAYRQAIRSIQEVYLILDDCLR